MLVRRRNFSPGVRKVVTMFGFSCISFLELKYFLSFFFLNFCRSSNTSLFQEKSRKLPFPFSRLSHIHPVVQVIFLIVGIAPTLIRQGTQHWKKTVFLLENHAIF